MPRHHRTGTARTGREGREAKGVSVDELASEALLREGEATLRASSLGAEMISGHCQRLVERAVTREAERLVQMERRVVVGADVEADRLDAGELAQHGARD